MPYITDCITNKIVLHQAIYSYAKISTSHKSLSNMAKSVSKKGDDLLQMVFGADLTNQLKQVTIFLKQSVLWLRRMVLTDRLDCTYLHHLVKTLAHIITQPITVNIFMGEPNIASVEETMDATWWLDYHTKMYIVWFCWTLQMSVGPRTGSRHLSLITAYIGRTD